MLLFTITVSVVIDRVVAGTVVGADGVVFAVDAFLVVVCRVAVSGVFVVVVVVFVVKAVIYVAVVDSGGMTVMNSIFTAISILLTGIKHLVDTGLKFEILNIFSS